MGMAQLHIMVCGYHVVELLLQGMIMGPKTAISMLIGAILGKLCCSAAALQLPRLLSASKAETTSVHLPGFGVLGPYARSQGWAPGPIGSWRTGATGSALHSMEP